MHADHRGRGELLRNRGFVVGVAFDVIYIAASHDIAVPHDGLDSCVGLAKEV